MNQTFTRSFFPAAKVLFVALLVLIGSGMNAQDCASNPELFGVERSDFTFEATNTNEMAVLTSSRAVRFQANPRMSFRTAATQVLSDLIVGTRYRLTGLIDRTASGNHSLVIVEEKGESSSTVNDVFRQNTTTFSSEGVSYDFVASETSHQFNFIVALGNNSQGSFVSRGVGFSNLSVKSLDADGDGVECDTDPDDTDACLPTADNTVCPTGDPDGDGVANADEASPADAADPCLPNPNNAACPTGDSDFDGVANGDESAAGLEDPCSPNAQSLACPTGDTDNDGVTNGAECPNCFDDADMDGVPNYLDDDDNDAAVGNDDGQVANGFDLNRNGTADINDPCFPEYDPATCGDILDPTGFFYCTSTGEIIPGGSISVASGGPTEQFVVAADGSDGFYQFFPTTVGTFTLTVTVPPGFELDPAAAPTQAFTATAGGVDQTVGSDDADGDGTIDDLTVAEMGGNAFAQSYTFTFNDITDGDIFLANIPLLGCAVGLEVDAQATCADETGAQAEENTYFVRIDSVVSEDAGPFDVTIGGVTQTFTTGTTTELFFGPFNHSGAGGSVQLVSVTSQNDATVGGSAEVVEVLCGVTPDGGQTSGGFCLPTTDPDAPTGAILAQSAPGSFMTGGTSGQVQTYVLVDDANFIVQSNGSGLFTGLPSDTFQVFAVNYRDGEVLDEFLNPGQSFQPVLDAFLTMTTNTALDNSCYTICDTDPIIMVPVNCLSIGSTVFTDNDDDATFEPGDGEEGIGGVTVNLYTASDPVGAPGALDSLVATTTTDGDGNYFFGGLDEGAYTVSIPTTPDGFPLSSSDATTPEDEATGDNVDSGIQAAAGDSVVSPLITLAAQTEPANVNEPGIGGDQDDNVVTATATSDDDLNGDMTVDFGFFPGLSVGSTVFADLNNNAEQDPTEMGIAGVEVTLYTESDPDLAPGVFDSIVGTQLTQAMGDYFFDGLSPGNYVVGADPSDEFPLSSTDVAGSGSEDPENNIDGDDNGVFTDLTQTDMMPEPGDAVFSGILMLSGGMEPTDGAGETGTNNMLDGVAGSAMDANGNMTVDFGFFPGLSIGSTVFNDNNNDGVYDFDGGETPIAGVQVALNDAAGVPVDTVMTDAAGNYLFAGLTAGDYTVAIISENFADGAPLGEINTSSAPTESGDEDIDNNDNGVQPVDAATMSTAGQPTTSGTITLSLGDEPVNGAGPDGENGPGSEQDDMMDANGNMTVDFGFYTPVSIGSQVFLDVDNSGDNNAGTETGIDGVTVELFDDVDDSGDFSAADTLVTSTVTMNGGLYLFDDLSPGDYIVGVTPPADGSAGLSSNGPGESTDDDQTDDNDNGIQAMANDVIYSVAVNLAPGEEPVTGGAPGGENATTGGDQDDVPPGADDDGDMTVDFGLVPAVSVGSNVFVDTDNSGTREDTEPGVGGITVELLNRAGEVVATDTTDGMGDYFFGDLFPGDYQIRVATLPDSLPFSSLNPATSGDQMTDSDDDGNQDGGRGTEITTDFFTLTPGAFGALVEDGSGGDQDGDDGSDADANGNMTIDIGLVPNYSLGSTVFADLNNNAEQDADEVGVAGVPVTLYLDDGDGVFDPAVDEVVTTANTGPDGNYFFDGLSPGDYFVGIEPTDELPLSSNEDLDSDDPNVDETDGDDNGIQAGGTGAPIVSGVVTLGDGIEEPSGADESGQGGDQDDASTLDDVSGNQTIDFGLFPGVSLGSTVFADLDNSGAQDAGEEGIGGVTVLLYSDEAGDGFTPGVDTIVATEVTDADGLYLFDMLAEGNYVVAVDPSVSFPISSTGPAADMAAGDADLNTDGNDNGIFNNMGMTPAAFDTVYSGTVNLVAGQEPTDGDESASGGGQDNESAVQDANGNMTVDFGFFPGLSIGSTVFFDNDNDGLYEPSDGESGIVGVQLFLYAADGVTVLDSTTTTTGGNYFFGNLDAGDYIVGIPESSFVPGQPLESSPASSDVDEADPNADVDNNDNGLQPGGAGTIVQSGLVTLVIDGEPTAATGEIGEGADQDDANDANGNMTVDFGFYPTVSIGSQVFQDIDNSGDRNDGEMGVAAVEVLLFEDVDGNNSYTPGVDTLVDMTTTDAMGLYEFDTLAPGDYIVAVIPPVDNNLSSNGPNESTADDQSDDNDNGIQGMAGDTIFSTAINLMVGEEPEDGDLVGGGGPGADQDNADDQDDDGDETIDFGILPSVSVGSTVFRDDDNDGILEVGDGEEGIEGLRVELLDANGDIVAADTTDAMGLYFFDGLTPGDYQIRLPILSDDLATSSTNPATSGDEMTDNDDDGNQDGGRGSAITTDVFTLAPGAFAGLAEDGPGGDQDGAPGAPGDADGNMTIDLGLVPNYSIGSTVFADINNDAEQGADEEGVAGVPVTLFQVVDDGAGTVDTIEVATQNTSADGDYFFDGLLPGDYIVGIQPTDDLPFSSDEMLDEDDPNSDVDGDDNGTQGVDGMPGAAGDPIFSGIVTLGADGTDEPVDGAEGGQGGDQDDDSPLADASGNMTVDFGLFPGVSLGSTVFADLDNSGLQDANEEGIPGVTVLLYSDEDGDGFTPGVDSIVATEVTDGDGQYFFDMLPEGNYVVAVAPDQSFPVSSTGPAADMAPGDADAADTDGNDSGILNGMNAAPAAFDTVFSGTVSLTAGDEPLDADETFPGGDQDNGDGARDANGNMTVDFGFFPGLSIGSTVFFDTDDDGNYEPSDGETGIAGVQVFLYADDGTTVLDSMTTDSEGNYFFGGLDDGDYIVGIPTSSFAVGQPLEGAPASSSINETDPNDDGDNNDNGLQPGGAGTIVQSGIVTLTSNGEPTAADGETGEGAEQDDANDANGNMTVDFGFFATVSIGSQVFQDINNSGDLDGAEAGIEDVPVLLYADVDDNNMYTPGVDTLVAMTVTDAMGLYEFDTLAPGDYIVGVVPPVENNLSSNGPNESTADDGVDGNDNGIQAMAGDTVFSTAIDLMVGTEPVGEASPGGTLDDDDDQDDDGDMTIDFGLLPSVSVGSTVFQDTDNSGVQDNGEQGIEDVVVSLLDAMGTVVATDTTDADGNYFFGSLAPGDYELVINMVPDSLPNSSSLDNVGGEEGVDANDNGLQPGGPGTQISSGLFTLAPDTEPIDEPGQGGDQDDPTGNDELDDDGDMTLDFGLVPSYSIGSTVFADLDNSATQDDGELGVPGVEVTLYQVTDDGAGTLDTVAIGSRTTDDDGNYFFGDLLPGDYIVGIVPTDALPLSSEGNDDDSGIDGNDNGIQEMAGDSIFSTIITLDGNEPTADDTETGQAADQDDASALADRSGDQTVDFGLFPGLSVGSTVFFDLDDDGMLESSDGETGIPGVEVYLYAEDGVTVLDSTTTNSLGNYLFAGLAPGNYIVGIPASSFADGEPLSGAQNSSTPTDGEADDGVDNNDNGAQPGGAGTLVQSGIITLAVGTEPTMADGENGLGADQDDALDANGDMTIDFGFFPTMSIGSQVFYDLDNSGDNNGGTEAGVDEVLVLLYDDTDGNNVYSPGVDVFVDSMRTMGGGLYQFDTLMPGDYIVAIVPPDTANLSSNGPGESLLDDQADGNDNGTQAMAGDTIFSTAINLTVGDEPTNESGPGGDLDDGGDQDDDGDMTIDFGILPSVSVGSTVFADVNNDGVQDDMGNEPGVPGVIVDLLDAMGAVVASDTTDADGNYFFGSLAPGDYELVINMVPDSLPNSSTLDNVGGEEGVDANDNGLQPGGLGTQISSGVFTLTPNTGPIDEPGQGGDQDDRTGNDELDDDGDMTLDFGLVPSYSIGSTVFADLDNNAMQGDGEAGVPGVEVTLYQVTDDGTGTLDTVALDSRTTDDEGNYFFGDLLPGDYIVGIVPTDALPLSSEGNDDDSGIDGNDNGIQEMAGDSIFSSIITLDGNEPTADDTETGQAADQDDASALADRSGDQTVDFGLFPGLSIGSTVFFDLDDDGMLESSDGETGIPGVEVYLYAEDGVTVLDSTTTNSLGNYIFAGLAPGNYIVGIPASSFAEGEPLSGAPSSSTPTDGEADDGVDNNDNGAQPGGSGTLVQSGIITLAVGTEPTMGDGENGLGAELDDVSDANGDMTSDFGFFPTMTIGSQVFYDLDNSGDNNGGTEAGVDEVLVLLYDDTDGNNVYSPGVDVFVDSVRTMSGGLYQFDTLMPGDYIVAIVPPDTANLSSNGPGESLLDDQADGNDNGTQAMAGDTIFSTAINLSVGDEPTTESGPGGDLDDGGDQDDDGDMTIDFGILPSVSVGSTVFADLNNDGVQDDMGNEPGVPGVIVDLLDELGAVVATDTTDADGNYFFDGLNPGTYQLAIMMVPDSLPNSSTDPATAGDDMTDGDDDGMQTNPGDPIFSAPFTLTPNGEPLNEPGQGGDLDAPGGNPSLDDDGNMTYDFGLFAGASIGSTVFFDENNDGEQSLGESGIPGVLVVLLDEDMMPIDSTFTDPNGLYFFDGLQSGGFFVQIPTENFAAGNALEVANFSSEATDLADNQEDGDDNGAQPDGFGGVVTSPLITLELGTEPTGFDESASGGAQDDDSDANGDMTVDFGFVAPAFDLALIAELGDDQAPNVSPGDTVTYTITVFNQGNIAAGLVEITDGIPPGLSFPADANPDWALGADGQPSTVLTSFDGLDSLAPNSSVMVDIRLIVNAPLPPGPIINLVEISDDANSFGQPVDDIDSTPDRDLTNDEFEQDNAIDGNGLGGEDEDDHDQATLNVQSFDLALTKALSPGQPLSASPGDTILFDIIVRNQGEIAADSIGVVDFIPEGLNFSADLPENALWALGTDGMTATRILSVENGGLARTLVPGSSDTAVIALILDSPLPAGTVIRNIAEIQSAQDSLGNPQSDIDSDYNVPGEGPDDIEDGDDNVVDGTGMNGSDEDESDFADIGVNAFDLALRKNLSPGQSVDIDPGEDVRFNIVIINQGEVTADNITVRDYLPENFIISPSETDFVDGGTDAPTAVATLSVANGLLPAGGLAPGEQDTIEITLILDMADAGQLTYRNIAEIESTTDGAGNPVTDIDSEYADPDNPDLIEETDDGTITENGLLADQDEDESDFETVITRRFDLALTKILDGDEMVNPGDTVTFDITVINQGTIGADSVVVSDYMPSGGAGFVFDPSLNPGWTLEGPIAGSALIRLQTVLMDFDGAEVLLPNESVQVPIRLVVSPAMSTNATITNTAEISDATGPIGQSVIDVDSPMDTDPTNDLFTQDNEINGNGLAGGDEDNSDPASVTTGGFDLALIKRVAADQSTMVNPGDTITYDLIVINQGSIAADNIPVVDYIPEGLSIDMTSGNWMEVGSGDGFTAVSDTFTVADGELPAGGLQPGASTTLQINLVLDAPLTGGSSLRNVAELGQSTDENGNPQADDDSTPADPNAPDVVDEADDDDVNGNGPSGGDEDESDFATITVNVFDLALVKTLAPGQMNNVNPGDTVNFSIRVFNQGTVAADNIRVSDYVTTLREGFTFPADINPEWSVYATLGDTTYVETTLTDFDGAESLAPGSFADVAISLILNPAMEDARITNLAEISDATDGQGNPVIDIDSPMDTIPGNDDFFTDNDINGDGTTGGDEDNSDPAVINVGGGFDLALIKTISAGQSRIVNPGDDVSFDVTVINQGDITADNVVLSDYVPDGFLFVDTLNPEWTFDPATDIATTTLSIANGELFFGGLGPDERRTVKIFLTVAPEMFPAITGDGNDMINMEGVAGGERLVNEAEITAATDLDGVAREDIDSTPDDVQGNDGEIDDDDENGGGDTDGDGIIDDDEDDNDIAIIEVRCYQNPGFGLDLQVCLGCDEAVVSVNLFDGLAGLPSMGGTFTALGFTDDAGNPVEIDLSDPTNVIIPGTVDRSRDYIVTYTIPSTDNCAEQTSAITIDIFDIQNLSCTGFQNISLGEDCEAVITPELILQGNLTCASALEIVLLDQNNDTIRDETGQPTTTVGNDHLNQTLYVNLVDQECDNACWGEILVEDKRRPQIECPEAVSSLDGIDFICTDLDSILNLASSFDFTGSPVFSDNCAPNEDIALEFFDYLQPNDNPMCTPQTIVRTFTVTDPNGSERSCTQEITVRPATLADVTIPTETFVEISCNENTDVLANGNPSPSVTPQPFVTTAFGTYPVEGGGAYCSLLTQFTDGVQLPLCENSFEFTRTYQVIDWCNTASTPITYSQLIRVGDFAAPTFATTATADAVYRTGDSDDCGAVFRLDDPRIQISDNCATDITVTAVIYPNGNTNGTPIGTFFLDFEDDTEELSTSIPVGDHIIRYTYSDVCKNEAFTDVPFSVVDGGTPSIVCEDGLNVSLSMSSAGGPGTAVLTPDNVIISVSDACTGVVSTSIAILEDGQTEENADYQDFIMFDCDNIGTENICVRVEDANGNVSYCSSEIIIDMKIDFAPTCAAPAGVVLTTDEFAAALVGNIMDATTAERDRAFGAATGVGMCDVSIEDSVVDNLSADGVGAIVRSFVVTSTAGTTTRVSTDACTQVITVVNDNSPTIAIDAPTECIAAGGDVCTADVALSYTATGACATATTAYAIDANYDGTTFVADDVAALGITVGDTPGADGVTFSVQADGVPVGDHAVRITVTDACGNSSEAVVPFCVSSDLTPTPICQPAVTVPLVADADGTVGAQLMAADLVMGDATTCSGASVATYSIFTEEDVANGTAITDDRPSLPFTCDEEDVFIVRVYAFAGGNTSDYCQVAVEVSDPSNLCEDVEAGRIAGVMMTELAQPVENTTVELTSSTDMEMTMVTSSDGAFNFRSVDLGDDYTITPTHFVDYLNGVRTSDIVAITRHILGVDLLETPYQRIAADVDGTTEINVGDIINIRRLILGLSDTYPNGIPSWAFIPADHDFADMTDPWAQAYPSVLNYNNLSGNQVAADFIGVKIGDVNNSARANRADPARPRDLRGTLELELDELTLQQGETYRVPVTAPDLTSVDGYQFTLEFDRTAVSITTIEPGLVKAGSFGYRYADIGLITTSWNWEGSTIPTDWAEDEVLFTLVINAEANGRLSDALEAGSRYTEAEAYRRGGAGLSNLGLVFNEDVIEVAGYRLLQNIPNPVAKETTIGFELPIAHDKVTVAITDAAGRLVREYTQAGAVGYNSLRVTKRQLGGASGVFTYTVVAGNWVATKRMVIIE